MMNKQQLLLIKLMEEAAEVVQAASKSIQFGFDDIIPGTDTTNRQRLNAEITDFLAIIEMLNEASVLNYVYDAEVVQRKKLKVEQYAQLSDELGFVQWKHV